MEIENLSQIMYFMYFLHCIFFFKKHFLSTGEIKIAVITNYYMYLVDFGFSSSPEHEVLMVSYCDQSMSVVRRASCVVRRQQFVLKANSS